MVAMGWQAVAQIWAGRGHGDRLFCSSCLAKDDPELAERKRSGVPPKSLKDAA
jgi:NNP family nitrate/nitrite transporter-like MFS transporter